MFISFYYEYLLQFKHFIDILDKMMGKRESSILEESERYRRGGEL